MGPAWDSLNEACGGPPILNSSFVLQALLHFGTGDEMVAARGPAGKEDVMAVLVSLSCGRWQTFQPSQMPLGAWLMARDVSYRDAAAGLFGALPGMPLMLGVTQQDPAMAPRPCNGPLVQTLDYIDTGWISIEGKFHEFWGQRSPKLRQNMRTQHARLMREGRPVLLEELTASECVDEVMACYVDLESTGWKAGVGTALTSGSTQSRFYINVMKDFCRSGLGHIYRLRFCDQVAAIDLCISNGDTLVLLKTAYDESVQGVSPSTLLKHLAWQRLFDTRSLRRCEFYGPFMPWTSRWTSHRRRLFHVNCYRWPLVRHVRDQWQHLRPAIVPN